MKNTLYLFIVLFLVSCKAKNLTNKNLEIVENNIEKTENNSFSIESFKEIDKQDLLFSINKLAIIDKKLYTNLQYSGGCVKPHIFKLVTNGVINSAGNMEFYILHKTHNDKCKALFIENHVFDLSELYDLKSNLLQTITINNLKELPL